MKIKAQRTEQNGCGIERRLPKCPGRTEKKERQKLLILCVTDWRKNTRLHMLIDSKA